MSQRLYPPSSYSITGRLLPFAIETIVVGKSASHFDDIFSVGEKWSIFLSISHLPSPISPSASRAKLNAPAT
ncbi:MULTISPECIES: hypothetical protein [Aerosakkonema]|uniref:hypothetical protein n=1 Tax=Aerosakkonema TaxID=1246629 RepID=UPI0035BC4A1B